LTASTSKKVVVKRFDRELVTGYVNPGAYLLPEGVEVLTTTGARSVLPYADVKAVYFVRDFSTAGEQSEQRLFHARPKLEGLWVRMRFRDGELMDGLLPNALMELDAAGFAVVPPNPTFNNQRVFVPRSALTEFHVLAVVGSPLRPRKAKAAPKTQLEMFE
jgi:hypothetical protein